MKKRQELATQMQIEAVKDVRGEIDCLKKIDRDSPRCLISEIDGDFSLETYINATDSEYTRGRTDLMYLDIHNKLILFHQYKKFYIEDGGSNEYIAATSNTCAEEKFYHIVCTRKNRTISIYIDGVFHNSIEKTKAVAPLNRVRFNNINDNWSKTRHKYARIFNYALSADEVTTLYNNGKPEGYVLHLKKKNISNKNYADSFTTCGSGNGAITTSDTVNKIYTIDATSLNNPNTNAVSYISVNSNTRDRFKKGVLYHLKLKIVSNMPFRTRIYPFDIYNISAGDNYIDTTYVASDNNILHIYPTDGVFITMSDFDIKELGCIAEYLPQNLISTNDGVMNATTATKWLDSAKQLPDNDECLEPLFESIGGYDLTASGTPEIIFKQ